MAPDSWATYFYMGKAKLELKDAAAAIGLLRQAAEMNSDDPGVFYLLGRALRSEGRTQEAETAFRRVAALHSTALDAEKRALQSADIVGTR